MQLIITINTTYSYDWNSIFFVKNIMLNVLNAEEIQGRNGTNGPQSYWTSDVAVTSMDSTNGVYIK